MTQSDKDFITRIQVSQLVTQDPYADDFYAQVYGAIVRSRLGLQPTDERVLKFGSSGGVGLGMGQKGSGRRPSAMQKMEQQVERIVNNARQREQEKREHLLGVYHPISHNTNNCLYQPRARTAFRARWGRPPGGVIKRRLGNCYRLIIRAIPHIHTYPRKTPYDNTVKALRRKQRG
jgi:Topoisomerase II-associated protein PAT1